MRFLLEITVRAASMVLPNDNGGIDRQGRPYNLAVGLPHGNLLITKLITGSKQILTMTIYEGGGLTICTSLYVDCINAPQCTAIGISR